MTAALRVSAIITAYNSEPFLADAIESVLAQTRPVDEIVVVDDGSTDGTAAVAARYAARGVRYLFQANAGPGAARNRGIAETSGELLAFLDADDLWLPDKNALQLAYLAEHPGVALISGDRWRWTLRDQTRQLDRYGPPPRRNARQELLVRNIVGNPSMVLLQRWALTQAGLFDTGLRWAEDWECFIRVADLGEVSFIPKPLIVYRAHEGGLSSQHVWARFPRQFQIARDAIVQRTPPHCWPLLLLRAWSEVEHQRAYYAVQQGYPRYLRSWHAALALAAYPAEHTARKAGLLARSLLGESLYRRLRGRLSAAEALAAPAPPH